jgi:hypothetical protein
MSFITETFKISLFLPEGVKTDFKNIKRASEFRAVKWKKQQRFVIKFFWLREYHPRQIHQELLAILESDADSEDSVQYWVVRFQSGMQVAQTSRNLADSLQNW